MSLKEQIDDLMKHEGLEEITSHFPYSSETYWADEHGDYPNLCEIALSESTWEDHCYVQVEVDNINHLKRVLAASQSCHHSLEKEIEEAYGFANRFNIDVGAKRVVALGYLCGRGIVDEDSIKDWISQNSDLLEKEEEKIVETYVR